LSINAALDSLDLEFVDDAAVTVGNGIFADIAGAGVASAAVHRTGFAAQH
jgi:hypothetical protein